VGPLSTSAPWRRSFRTHVMHRISVPSVFLGLVLLGSAGPVSPSVTEAGSSPLVHTEQRVNPFEHAGGVAPLTADPSEIPAGGGDRGQM
jgi:hypothetical protein